MTALLCPLCSQSRFNNLESLRFSLVKAATKNISCPICNEILMGLDKLTIHLFGHAMEQNPNELIHLKQAKSESPVGSERLTESEKMNDSNNPGPTTINMDDLSFLTSWENCFRADEAEDKGAIWAAEAGNELSELMSDLLSKKSPGNELTLSSEELMANTKQEQLKCDFHSRNSILLPPQQQESTRSKAQREEGPKEGNEDAFMVASSASPLGVKTEEVLKEIVLPQYDCHLCQKSFKMRGSLLVHHRVVHLDLSHSDSSLTLTNQDEMEEMNFPCSICNKSFKKIQHLTQHIKTHQGKQWKCETCNKYFTTKYFLKKHQRLHTGEMPYSCQTCNKTFTFQQSYHKHLLYHTDEKPHQCTQCGRSFKELSTLHNHQRIHSGEKPFPCESCGKCFRQRVSYMVHRRIHTGVLPYQCTACKKQFRYKVSQRSHKCIFQPPGMIDDGQSNDLIQPTLDPKSNNFSFTQQANNQN